MDIHRKEEDIKTLRLLYEFSPNSPLFARIAEQEIIDGNYPKALELLSKGLKIYPNYPSAKILLAKTYAHLGQRENALAEIESLQNFIYEKETIDFYLDEIENILNSELTESGAEEEPSEEIHEADFDNPEIVSETLAGIYRAQGSLDEAIKMYKLLLKKHPEKSEYFEKIIAELEIETNNEG